MTPPGRTGALTLPDGRVLEHWTGGDPTGCPVLFLPGTPSSRLQAAHAHQGAASAGVRLVSLSRPGYGGSTPTRPGLAAVGGDVAALADALGIGTFAVLGVSGGGPYALATAVSAPARVNAVGVLAGIGPWPEVTPPTRADRADRDRLRRARSGDLAGATEAFHDEAHQAFDAMLALDDAEMVREFLSGTPEEELDLTPEAEGLWAADLREALRTYDGFVRDNLSWGCPWDIDVGHVSVPAHLWYGERDEMVPVAHGRWLAARIPGAELVVLAGQGHGRTTFGHWNEVFRTLARAGRRRR
jgi:pimeloyl-ACP methyl ester carboxylesterase